MKIKILIPVYNDWQSVFKLLENINSEVSDLDHEFSVIIVNDASNETKPELSSSLDNLNSIKIINMKENRGHARCNAAGLKHIYENEEFDSKMSKQFEKNGFGWTENGGLWKIGLSNEQANAEVRLAQVKQQQQKILEREQAKVDILLEN